MKNLSNEKSPSRRRPCLVGATLPAAPAVRSAKSRHFSTQLQREDVPGCKQVPPDEVDGKILWAHPDGYFLNAQGQKLVHTFSPAMQRGFTAANLTSGGKFGSCYPIMRNFGKKLCHYIMALAFYGERPTYTGKNGKPYVGICHHLIPDKFDYRPANLLCWLTKEQHAEADRRQRILRKTLPDLHTLGYDRLRTLQDPRVTSQEDFAKEINSPYFGIYKL